MEYTWYTYWLYLYLSLFILFLNHSLFCAISFSLQQLVCMAMGWEYISYQVSSMILVARLAVQEQRHFLVSALSPLKT